MKQKRIRLFIDKRTSAGQREKIIYLAIEKGCNTLVLSMDDKYFEGKNEDYKYIKLINNNALFIEAGGHNLRMLLPRKKYFFQRDLFRMDQGRRKTDHHFCPTNPRTISIVSENAEQLFSRVLEKVTTPRIFHLLPDKNHENTWCSCPACRAFTPPEQYLMILNTASDALAKLDNEARIIYLVFDKDPQAQGIIPRKNLIASKKLT